jgi:hypothetical protein
MQIHGDGKRECKLQQSDVFKLRHKMSQVARYKQKQWKSFNESQTASYRGAKLLVSESRGHVRVVRKEPTAIS